jgi:hypothetical protein
MMALSSVCTLVEAATPEASVCETSPELVESPVADVWLVVAPSSEETAEVIDRAAELEPVFVSAQAPRIRAAPEKEKRTLPGDFFSFMVGSFTLGL